MTRSMDPEVMAAICESIEPLFPSPDDTHPLGCRNRRVSDQVFSSNPDPAGHRFVWTDIEAIMYFEASNTTFGNVAIVGSLHNAPSGGEGAGKGPVDRAKLDLTWSVTV